jgi:hypothetical protein
MRTTLNIEDPVLAEAKRIQRREGKSLGGVVSELMAEALERRQREGEAFPPLRWIVKPMGERVDVADKEALYRALDERERVSHRERSG